MSSVTSTGPDFEVENAYALHERQALLPEDSRRLLFIEHQKPVCAVTLAGRRHDPVHFQIGHEQHIGKMHRQRQERDGQDPEEPLFHEQASFTIFGNGTAAWPLFTLLAGENRVSVNSR